jgi:hypothetical protein
MNSRLEKSSLASCALLDSPSQMRQIAGNKAKGQQNE